MNLMNVPWTTLRLHLRPTSIVLAVQRTLLKAYKKLNKNEIDYQFQLTAAIHNTQLNMFKLVSFFNAQFVFAALSVFLLI